MQFLCVRAAHGRVQNDTSRKTTCGAMDQCSAPRARATLHRAATNMKDSACTTSWSSLRALRGSAPILALYFCILMLKVTLTELKIESTLRRFRVMPL